MKQLLLSISFIYSINCLAQVSNPDLFQTWYLHSVFVSDGGAPFYKVSEIEPTIKPFLTIQEDMTFNGIGACNSFNGTFKISDSNTLETEQFTNSMNDCGIETHSSFENAYFSFMNFSNLFYNISSVDNVLTLTFGNSIFGQAVFKNSVLNTNSFELNKIEIYPNPTKSLIHIKYKNNNILKVEIFNFLGQKIKIIKNQFDTIDISDLPNGIHLTKIHTELGILNKKIIKE